MAVLCFKLFIPVLLCKSNCYSLQRLFRSILYMIERGFSEFDLSITPPLQFQSLVTAVSTEGSNNFSLFEFKHIDYQMGGDSGYIHFEEPESAQKARAVAVLAESGLTVKNFFASLEPVSGEAEKEYWSVLLRGSQDRRGGFKGN
ncbi:hypothetical protein GIB67_035089 [Kingdonia uniflora]|uniref:XRRM domain-containing protein n=1 Tax=Kingdonia uniflora TaxID=39325 RepID=A0A7J7MCB8_9MAGN|nr:hypothetical protein GIB67_035089 [Kingdonia uniflora]